MDARRRALLARFAAVAAGCIAGRLLAADALPSCTTGSQCSALSTEQLRMVTVLAEHVIPETDSPGAAKAGVGQFIDHMVSEWYTPQEREIFLAGLVEVNHFCRSTFARDFLACSSEQQVAALQAAQAAMGSYRPPAPVFPGEPDQHSPFFHKLKELTVIGYYTSEVGATTELNYNPVPGRFDADVDYTTLGRQWST